MADGWRETQLIRAIHCLPHGGMFDNQVAILVGSNSEFLKESRPMSSWLDVERLYLTSRDSGRALLLLPLIQVGPTPTSAKNACYFFNRVEKDSIRFVSYHFVDQPELKDESEVGFFAGRKKESDCVFVSDVGLAGFLFAALDVFVRFERQSFPVGLVGL